MIAISSISSSSSSSFSSSSSPTSTSTSTSVALDSLFISENSALGGIRGGRVDERSREVASEGKGKLGNEGNARDSDGNGNVLRDAVGAAPDSVLQ